MTFRSTLRFLVIAEGIVVVLLCARSVSQAAGGTEAILPSPDRSELAVLGRQLFFDTSLSHNRTQSCASCHDPALAFTDGRDNGVAAAVSLGDDGRSLGDRNASTLTYAVLTPEFEEAEEGIYLGGQFHDGRAATLAAQAAEPFVNPIEMGMADTASVVARVMENPGYIASFRSLFGQSVFDDTERAYRAVARSIEAFEKTEEFAPFDSRYDRYLRGEYALTKEEELGRLFFVSGMINCTNCHQLNTSSYPAGETFTDYRYYNIGVPANEAVRKRNGMGTGHRDVGLLEHPAIQDSSYAGKFRVPTLRNVAVTGPYMHNGVFQDLRTVIRFYTKYLVVNEKIRVNPETGQPWAEPEVKENLDLDLLGRGQPLADETLESAVLAFLKTLTDHRYEALLDK